MHHSEQKCAHFCSVWRIVGYGTRALMDLWIRSVAGPQYILEFDQTMSSWHGNTFLIIGPLPWAISGIPSQMTNNAKIWCRFRPWSEQVVGQNWVADALTRHAMVTVSPADVSHGDARSSAGAVLTEKLDVCTCRLMWLSMDFVTLSGTTRYHRISRNLETARLGVIMIVSLWKLALIVSLWKLALSNVRAIGNV